MGEDEMRRFIPLVLLCGLMLFPAVVKADTVVLKNGNSVKGIIKNEGSDAVELEIEIGTVKFSKKEIQAVEHSESVDNQALRARWEDNRQDEKEARDAQLKVEAERQRQDELKPKSERVAVDSVTGHMIAGAVINGKVKVNLIVDTGATMIVLSKRAGDMLVREGVAPKTGKVKKVELTLGDGSKAKADLVLLDSVSVDKSSAEDVEAAILGDEGSTPGYDGVLGMSFLSRFNFSFNQKEGRLTLEKLK
jgi:clan AA aspartic protease (TIGR02281 family)